MLSPPLQVSLTHPAEKDEDMDVLGMEVDSINTEKKPEVFIPPPAIVSH